MADITRMRTAPMSRRRAAASAVLALFALAGCSASRAATLDPSGATAEPPTSRPDAGTSSTGKAVPAPTSTLASLYADTVPTLPPTSKPRTPGILRIGDRGPKVEALQQRLRALGYDPGPVDGQFGAAVLYSVWAFQRVNGLVPDGDVGPLTLAALDDPEPVAPMQPDGPPERVEVSIDRQFLVLYKAGRPALITHVSSGSQIPFCENGVCGDAVTPLGDFTTMHKIEGWEDGPLGPMYNSIYFKPAYAIHGAANVPDVGASHGCVRIPMHIAEYFPGLVGYGFAVHIQQD
jgi:hypothetical protein